MTSCSSAPVASASACGATGSAAEEQQPLERALELDRGAHAVSLWRSPIVLALAERLDRDLGERLLLGPGRLALLVELEQRVEGDRDRHAVRARHGLGEREPPAPQQRPQVGQPLGDRHLGDGHVAQVDGRRDLEQRADRADEHRRVVDRSARRPAMPCAAAPAAAPSGSGAGSSASRRSRRWAAAAR